MKHPLGSQLDTSDDEERHLQPQEPISFPLLAEGIPITRKEHDIIKLTAQFVAVFGMYFEHDLKLRKEGASTETVLEGYFNLVQQVVEKEEEEGAEIAMVDLQAFEYFCQVEYTDWRPAFPGYLSILKNPPPPQMQPRVSSPPPLPLVPEDQFLAQHPGSSTFRVSGTIEITVQPLSENVASLKEQIANKLEVSGKARVLDYNCLCDDNVACGCTEIRSFQSLNSS